MSLNASIVPFVSLIRQPLNSISEKLLGFVPIMEMMSPLTSTSNTLKKLASTPVPTTPV